MWWFMFWKKTRRGVSLIQGDDFLASLLSLPQGNDQWRALTLTFLWSFWERAASQKVEQKNSFDPSSETPRSALWQRKALPRLQNDYRQCTEQSVGTCFGSSSIRGSSAPPALPDSTMPTREGSNGGRGRRNWPGMEEPPHLLWVLGLVPATELGQVRGDSLQSRLTKRYFPFPFQSYLIPPPGPEVDTAQLFFCDLHWCERKDGIGVFELGKGMDFSSLIHGSCDFNIWLVHRQHG